MPLKKMICTCMLCGLEFEGYCNTRYCIECSGSSSRRKNKEMLEAQKKMKEQRLKQEEPKTLNEICAEARKAGMTYGKYVAMYRP